MSEATERPDKSGKTDFEINEKSESACFRIKGELDHHSVKALREEIDEKLILHRPKSVVLDLSGVSFTDSAGLGLILGRYTRITEYGGKLSLTGVSESFMKILRLAGTDKLIKTECSAKAGCCGKEDRTK